METRIKNILGKEDVSYHEAGELLRAAAAALQSVPNAAVRSVQVAYEDALSVIKATKSILATQDEIMEKIDAAEGKICDRYDQIYKDVSKKRYDIQDKLKTLDPLPDIHIPFNMKELVDICDRLKELPPVAFERFIELAKALK